MPDQNVSVPSTDNNSIVSNTDLQSKDIKQNKTTKQIIPLETEGMYETKY